MELLQNFARTIFYVVVGSVAPRGLIVRHNKIILYLSEELRTKPTTLRQKGAQGKRLLPKSGFEPATSQSRVHSLTHPEMPPSHMRFESASYTTVPLRTNPLLQEHSWKCYKMLQNGAFPDVCLKQLGH